MGEREREKGGWEWEMGERERERARGLGKGKWKRIIDRKVVGNKVVGLERVSGINDGVGGKWER